MRCNIKKTQIDIKILLGKGILFSSIREEA